ncbi:MAG TPA: phenylalanine--tRNA ligase subunit alpha [Planctomycetota bacterium]|nr:phenylalanine--tRNA ligase subunit alpha [Planctomycetota bacterium]
MIDEIRQLKEKALAEIERAAAEEIEALRVRYLGRKGIFKDIMGRIPALPAEQKPLAGKEANAARVAVEEALKARQAAIGAKPKPAKEVFDVTIPGNVPPFGRLHPITRSTYELVDIFARLGFEVVYGPEMELERYNFEALNIPAEHPARDSFDTFFIKDDILLRSHTSPVQVRTMMQRKPPLRIVAPGKVFRRDTPDASHYPVFHQIEGLVVDENITLADLKAVLDIAMKAFFGPETRTRMRPSFFPFTEPSAEVDIACTFCHGRGCSTCQGKGWTELLGAGMVDPNVFEAVGYDPEKYTGFAFGLGIDRAAMYRFGITDIRLLFDNDLRLLGQL